MWLNTERKKKKYAAQQLLLVKQRIYFTPRYIARFMYLTVFGGHNIAVLFIIQNAIISLWLEQQTLIIECSEIQMIFGIEFR